MKKEWGGIFPAIMVPLNEDYSINEQEYRNYIDWLISFKDQGITGLVTNGHTGEIAGFKPSERAQITKIAADQAAGRVKIVSGVCAEGTYEAIEHAQAAQAAGADGILLMPPHIWLRFGMKPKSALKFFQDVAAAIDIKIIVHLYPASTKAFYPIDLLLEMVQIPNVSIVKMGTRDMPLYEKDVRILQEKAPDISLLTCHDENLLSTFIQGVDGALIGFSGCVPELITALFKAVQNEDLAEAKKVNNKLFAASSAIYGIGQPSGEAHARMKEFLYQRKVFTRPLMRPPLLPLDQEEIDKVTKALADCGVKPVNLV
ncbi:MAG TPA: dihydrodipicolinate synthase family protein [Bacillota bacterium]|nr:dihydrodipicolinate synthase family protein [Bacillota bacterium]